jgi:hypothetical protein
VKDSFSNAADDGSCPFRIGDVVRWSDKYIAYVKQTRERGLDYWSHVTLHDLLVQRMRIAELPPGKWCPVTAHRLTPFGDVEQPAKKVCASTCFFSLAEDFR